MPGRNLMCSHHAALRRPNLPLMLLTSKRRAPVHGLTSTAAPAGRRTFINNNDQSRRFCSHETTRTRPTSACLHKFLLSPPRTHNRKTSIKLTTNRMATSSRRCLSGASSPIPTDGTPKTAMSEGSAGSIAESHARALNFAAQEANRLLSLSGMKMKNTAVESQQQAKQHWTLEKGVAQVLEIADALLTASRPSMELEDAILFRTSAASEAQVAILHRAFIAVTSWCLDTIPNTDFSDDDDSNASYQSIIKEEDEEKCLQRRASLDRALSLARRAYDLSLPLHLPLYQRLMLSVAEHYGENDSELNSALVTETILEISTWVKASLDAPVDSALFAPALTAMVRKNHLRCAVCLLESMRDRHSIDILDTETTMDLMALFKESFHQIWWNEADANPDPVLALQRLHASSLAGLLEPSVQHASENELQSMIQLARNLLSLMSEEELDDILRSNSEIVDKNYDEDSDDDYDDIVDNDQEEAETDKLDRVLDILLSQRAQKTRTLLVDVMMNKTKSEKEDPSVVEVTIQGEEDDNGFYDYLYVGNQYRFPDITEQVEQMNGCRNLRFTTAYEEILWDRDYADDADVILGDFDIESDDSSDNDEE